MTRATPARFAASPTDAPTSPVPTTARLATTGGAAGAGGGVSGRDSPRTSCFITSSTAAKTDCTARSESGPRFAVVELLEQLGLALRVDHRRARLLLALLHAGDELEPPVQRLEHLAVDRGDALAQLLQGQLLLVAHASIVY